MGSSQTKKDYIQFDNDRMTLLLQPNELGLPYWARSFQGKRIINDEEDVLQENDSEFLQSGTVQYQTRDRSSKEQGFVGTPDMKVKVE